MVASNYMTEADTESIWAATLDTTRFGKLGIRIAEQLNFWINDDATSQVTDAAVTPILEQISEEILMDLIASARLNAVTNPWDFIQSNVTRISLRILQNYNIILKKIMNILNRNKSIEIVTRTL